MPQGSSLWYCYYLLGFWQSLGELQKCLLLKQIVSKVLNFKASVPSWKYIKASFFADKIFLTLNWQWSTGWGVNYGLRIFSDITHWHEQTKVIFRFSWQDSAFLINRKIRCVLVSKSSFLPSFAYGGSFNLILTSCIQYLESKSWRNILMPQLKNSLWLLLLWSFHPINVSCVNFCLCNLKLFSFSNGIFRLFFS